MSLRPLLWALGYVTIYATLAVADDPGELRTLLSLRLFPPLTVYVKGEASVLQAKLMHTQYCLRVPD